MIEMNVAGVALDATTRLPIVLLKDASERRALPIWIGQTEARAILTALESQKTPRPMTHDLLVNCMDQLEVDLERVVIHSLQDNTFYAVLTLQQGDEKTEIDARPSDAIALALRMDSPIWVLEEVVSEASIAVDQEADLQEQEEFREFLDNIRPEDLIKSREGNEPSAESS